jgi:hypothetical protein
MPTFVSLETISNCCGLIDAPSEQVARTFADWQRSILASGQALHRDTIAIRSIPGNVEEGMQALLPRTMPGLRHVFIATRSRWTAMYDNSRLGTDPSAITVLARLCGCESIRVVAVRHQLAAQGAKHRVAVYGATILEVFDAKGTKRSVYAANDGGAWRFGQYGTPYPFERLDAYVASPVRSRFTPDMLRDYLAEFGARPFDRDWFANDPNRPSFLVERRTTLPFQDYDIDGNPLS